MSARPQKRKKRGKSRDGGDPAAPSTEDWEQMTPYGKFIVTDSDGCENVFALGDTAVVLPNGVEVGDEIPMHDYWVARLVAIRGRPPPAPVRRRTKKTRLGRGSVKDTPAEDSDIWAKVHWFYSPKEVSALVKGFSASHCSKYERIYSHHAEIISALTFDALVPVVKFREDDPNQLPIAHDQFFVRYFLETARKHEVLCYARSSERPIGCICPHPYDLNDPDPLRVMHMCPQPSCRRFYHRACLLDHGHYTRARACMADLSVSSPDRGGKSSASPPSPLATHGAVATPSIPDGLRKRAAQPIIRGAALHGFGFGITGNCHAVMHARHLVQQDDWQDEFEALAEAMAMAMVDVRLQLADTDEELVFTCPYCAAPI
ncbi:hypothetical protein GGX14DRAFT_417581 [Mycena pura]|uniref:BAH domain-containing protein n=1 Tax=Mycena pura TaxID=153505 RepID=A0AAD6YR24_9AGAR|nr:hypothetical protein GGX14DRAFT_417581 [Mycena pura]